MNVLSLKEALNNFSDSAEVVFYNVPECTLMSIECVTSAADGRIVEICRSEENLNDF